MPSKQGLSKQGLSERDICTKCITPVLETVGCVYCAARF